MAEYLHPGVYVERKPGGPAPIAGVSTSNFGICGFTKQGATDEAILVTSWEDFQRKFGSFTEKSLVPTSVYAFFANGGRRAYVVRVVASDAKAAYCDEAGTAVTGEVVATGDGVETHFEEILASPPVKRGSVTLDYTVGATAYQATDDGFGNLSGTELSSGTIDYETGRVILDFSTAPDDTIDITADYTPALWLKTAKYDGVWGNDLRVRIEGDEEYWDAETASYSRFNVTIYQYDSDLMEYLVKETFESVSLTDTTDASYFPAVINDPETGSDLIEVADTGTAGGIPTGLNGAAASPEVIATGDGTTKRFTGVLTANDPDIAKTTLTIDFVVGTSTFQIKDDGSGGFENVTGTYLDETKTNTIDYETGAYEINLTTAPDNTEDLTANHYQMPEESYVQCDFANGSDGGAISRTDVSHPNLEANYHGVYALGKTDEMMQVGIPDFAGDVNVANDLITKAESRGDWFIILATPSGLDPQEAKEYRQNTGAWNTRTAALYWPWIRITDPITSRATDIPAIGHVAGVYARTDTNKNVGKSPGGVEDGRLNFSIGLEYDVELAEIDILNPVGVNSLYQSTETGRVVWGVRTLEIGGEYRYINAQRLMMFLEKSLFRATHWVVFENNNSDLQVRVGQQVESFLLNLYRNNYFLGNSPAEAFFVICDGTNNPPESVDLGRLICDIGVAINKPAEFVIFRLQQKTLAAA